VYGLVKPLASFDPIRAQIHHFFDMARRTGQYRGLDRLRVWFNGPEWDHPPAPEITRAEQRKYSVQLSPRETTFLSVTLVLAIVGTTALLWYQDLVPWTLKAFLAAFLLALIAIWGLLLDRRAIWRRTASVASTEPGPL